MHYNVTKALQYAQHIADLPEQAREAEQMLEDESQLLQVRNESMDFFLLFIVLGGMHARQSSANPQP